MKPISFPLTALKSPAAFHEQIKSLERARVRNLSLKCSTSLFLSLFQSACGQVAVYFQDTWYIE